ncbi:MAG TPA: GNAT family N-acetyltransferase [Terracidiphilus sp.]
MSSRVEIKAYAHKIYAHGLRFEAWAEGSLIGLVAMYCNRLHQPWAYITNVSVVLGASPPAAHIASQLLERGIGYLREHQFERVDLEVDRDNNRAVRLYERHGFVTNATSGSTLLMRLELERRLVGTETGMSNLRDYDREMQDTAQHQYAYSFDLNVMHPFMLRSFEPFLVKGSLLELGSYKGDFTQRLLTRFDDVTCVEASSLAIEQARQKLGGHVTFVHSTFESATLDRRYDNIVLTHVLEHLDEPINVLKRVNGEWLSDNGRCFLACPNANAPSRQIAVKMGLITHNAAVTAAEATHGHRRTYSLDTLERDAVAAGLKVLHRSGIFFKALANFQWDQLLGTDIISKEYLEGCFDLGQHYPDLCSSIFLVCERG